MLGERIASQSEMIRAIVSGCGPCCGGAGGTIEAVFRLLPARLSFALLALARRSWLIWHTRSGRLRLHAPKSSPS